MPDLSALSPGLVLFVGLVFVLGGVVKGVIGLGLPTVAMGLLGLAMSPAAGASLLVLPSLVTNVWQLAAGPDVRALARRLWPLLVGICVGTALGAVFLPSAGGRTATGLLGLALLAYAAFGLANRRLSVPPRSEPWLGPLVGAATGAVTAATGVFVIPAVPYLGALGLARDDLVQALGLSFTVSTVALAAALAGTGPLDATTLGASVVAILPALAGMAFGGWLRERISPPVFRRVFFLGLLVLGAELAWRGLAPSPP